MGVFLDRQKVRQKKLWQERLRRFERVLLAVAIVLAGLALLYGVYCLTVLGPAFTVHRIVMDGKWKYLNADELAVQAGVQRGENLFWLSVQDIHKRLSKEPWVKAVAVQRKPPDTLWIYVEEHEPFAIVAGQALYYTDAEGNVFKKVEAGDDKDFPVITGVDVADSGGGFSSIPLRMREMINIIKMFRASRFSIGRHVAEVHYDFVRGYFLIADPSLEARKTGAAKNQGPLCILFGQTVPPDRFKRLDLTWTAIRSRGERIQYIVADETGRVTVKFRT